MIRPVFLVALLATAGASAETLELTDCRISAGEGFASIAARCADFERPLDPDNPSSETITLEVAVVRALSLEPATDAFVPIAGGPGQSSIVFYAGYRSAFEAVRRSRDIVLINQRGTGEAAGLTCDIDEDIVEGAYTAEETRRIAGLCLEQMAYDPRYFTTSVAVRDLEALRQALGYDAFNLYGISYGSRVAQHFARRFPDSTRTIILDGVVPPQVPLGPDIALQSQRAIDEVLSRCAEDDGCAASFATIEADFVSLRRLLSDGPMRISLPQPATGEPLELEFSHEQMAIAVRLLLYDQRTIALLPLLIHEAANGNFQPLAAQYQTTAAALTESLSVGMHNAVMCTEDLPFVDFEAIDVEAVSKTYMGMMQIDALEAICSVWPAGYLDDDLRKPLATDLPVLLLSGSADPITPPDYAGLAAAELENATPLIGLHQGHGQAAVGCMPRILGTFVDNKGVEDADVECFDRSFAMPFFVNFSGPTP